MSDYEFTTDTRRMDFAAIHGYLARSYWATGVPADVVRRAIENSLCFAVVLDRELVGFARVVTDKATFAYLADVFILEAHRGKGLSKRLMAFVLEHPDLQGLRRFLLATRDAHELYRRFGFKELAVPSRIMEINDPDVYRRASA